MKIASKAALALISIAAVPAAAWAQARPADAKPSVGKQPPTADGATFRGTPDLVGAIQISNNISPDRRAVTVIFRNLAAAVADVPPLPHGVPAAVVAARLDGLKNSDLRTATISLPVDAKGKEVRIHQDIRGHVDVPEDARAVLVVQAAGKTTVVDLKKATVKGGNYHQRIEATLPPGSIYQATLVVLVERLAGDPPRGGTLDVESFDVEIESP